MVPAVLNTVGLALDIFGAFILAYDVLKPMDRWIGSDGSEAVAVLKKSPPVKQKRSKRLAFRGVIVMAFGFALQIVAVWWNFAQR